MPDDTRITCAEPGCDRPADFLFNDWNKEDKAVLGVCDKHRGKMKARAWNRNKFVQFRPIERAAK